MILRVFLGFFWKHLCSRITKDNSKNVLRIHLTQLRRLCAKFFLTYFLFSEGLDRCFNVNCVHGTCLPTEDGYFCRCHPGYKGRNCEVSGSIENVKIRILTKIFLQERVDVCQVKNPCQQGICMSTFDGFYCSCDYGWTGCRILCSICYVLNIFFFEYAMLKVSFVRYKRTCVTSPILVWTVDAEVNIREKHCVNARKTIEVFASGTLVYSKWYFRCLFRGSMWWQDQILYAESMF